LNIKKVFSLEGVNFIGFVLDSKAKPNVLKNKKLIRVNEFL
jgi:hypothetical protein